jgi:hypothetical protein
VSLFVPLLSIGNFISLKSSAFLDRGLGVHPVTGQVIIETGEGFRIRDGIMHKRMRDETSPTGEAQRPHSVSPRFAGFQRPSIDGCISNCLWAEGMLLHGVSEGSA